MGVNNIIEDLSKKVKVYEVKKDEKDKKKLPLDNSSFNDNQKRLESELLKQKSEKDKEKSKSLESVVQNGQLTSNFGFEAAEKQHFEKQFEGIKAVYKHHEVVNQLKDGERPQDAYNSDKDNSKEHMHSVYQSSNPKSVYKNNNHKGY